jgi:hypothetical protein
VEHKARSQATPFEKLIVEGVLDDVWYIPNVHELYSIPESQILSSSMKVAVGLMSVFHDLVLYSIFFFYICNPDAGHTIYNDVAPLNCSVKDSFSDCVLNPTEV